MSDNAADREVYLAHQRAQTKEVEARTNFWLAAMWTVFWAPGWAALIAWWVTR